MLARSKFFSQFVEKIEKLELSLSKQHNKILKIRSEMLKIIKNTKMIKLGKISRISGISKKFHVSREVENPAKRETLVTTSSEAQAVSK